MSTFDNLSVKEWLDNLEKEGKTIEIQYNGGGDSGDITLLIDQEEYGGDIANYLIELAYEETGNVFDSVSSSDGSLCYQDGCFSGCLTIIHSEYMISDNYYLSEPHIIKIHKDVNFDFIMFDADDGHSYRVSAFILNGIEESIHDLINLDWVDEETDAMDFNHNDILNSFTIARNVFTEEGDYLVYKVESFPMLENEVSEESYTIDLS